MNATQTHSITNLIDAYWPNLRLTADEEKLHAWTVALTRLDYDDTLRAVTELSVERNTITLAHIGKRADRIRAERLASVSPLDLIPPADIADDGALYAAWLRTARDRASRVPA